MESRLAYIEIEQKGKSYGYLEICDSDMLMHLPRPIYIAKASYLFHSFLESEAPELGIRRWRGSETRRLN